MDNTISRSEQKRRAKSIEQLAHELVELSTAIIGKLPCDDFLRREIITARPLTGGARKRQIKYIAKELRQIDPDPLLAFLEERKGSNLKRDRELHELERLRQDILSEAIEAFQEAQANGLPLGDDWQSELAAAVAESTPGLDLQAVNAAARSFARIRKPAYGRELFRLLRAAKEQAGYR
ncbi:MAG: DUF615 domain-containing protein [Desulfobulbaceae bacterium]|nr:DUF615 domain-containing protein [Desulfobulbaceae bacterium]